MSALLRTLAAAPLALAVTLLGAAPAQASVIYTYTGNPFTIFTSSPGAPNSYTAANHVTLIMEFAGPLGADLTDLAVTPLSFTATDGINTITNSTATATASIFWLSTDANGSISSWNIDLSIVPQVDGAGILRRIITKNILDMSEVIGCGSLSTVDICRPDYSFAGLVNLAPGTWTVRNSTAVPEPTSLALIGLALAGLAARRRVR